MYLTMTGHGQMGEMWINMKKLLIALLTFCFLCTLAYAGSFGIHFKGSNVDGAAVEQTFGFTTYVYSDSTTYQYNTDKFQCGKFQSAGTSGTVTKMSVAVRNGLTDATTVAGGIYEDNAGLLGAFKGHTNAADPSAWTDGFHDLTMADTVSISASTNYWLCVWSDGDGLAFAIGRETTGGDGKDGAINYDISTWFSESDVDSDSAWNYAITCTYQ